MQVVTKSAKQTQKLGELLARSVLEQPHFTKASRGKLKTKALVLSLEGDLGTGKTTFTQGLAKGLGIKKVPRSPTFIIMQAFESSKRHRHLIHIDAYRISGRDLKTLGWKDLIKDSKNIIVIEWGTRISKFLPKGAVKIKFEHGEKFNERTIKISN